MSFAHLHVHTEFSLLDGAQSIASLVKRAAEMGMPALAITDHGAMYGVIDFYNECREQGVKPIIGMEAYVAPGGMRVKGGKDGQKRHHLLLLAQNQTGYRNLMKLATLASVEGFYYKPRIDKTVLAEHAEGLIGTSACLASEICSLLQDNDYSAAKDAAAQFRDIFGKDNFYIELQDHLIPMQKTVNEGLVRIAEDLKLPTICTNDVHYLRREDSDAHDVLLCIQTNSVQDDPGRTMKFDTPEFYLKTPEEMAELFKQFPGAAERTLEVAGRCDVKLDFERLQLPAPGVPEGLSAHRYVEKLCRERIGEVFPNGNEPAEKRMEYELSVIEQTGFSDYFLIVRDFANFAQRQGIYYGVRGSAAGSLVSYLLGITELDPIEHGLTFERFLNPERLSMPDIDMDFEDARRDEVIKYVVGLYGKDHVAQIITFGTMAARAAIRDAGRAIGIPLPDVDRVAKLVPTLPLHITIDQALEASPELKRVFEGGGELRKLIETARGIEGLARNASTHAAGVVISKDPLVENVPLAKGGNDEIVTQYPMAALDQIGLLKMDFLGLANLTVLAKAVANIKASRGEDIEVSKIPFDDTKTFEMLSRGETTGVFQLESSGMRRHIMELKPNTLAELAAMVALYRPGPMAHIPRYIAGKHGAEVRYPHDCLVDILKPTYGVIVYQDQVLQIVQAVAGFSLGEADVLRRAMGKKKKKDMERMEPKFFEGAAARGIGQKKAREIWDLLEPFARYAFNKAHAVCYAVVAYRTAYLKANYPVEYMAALMAAYRDTQDKVTGCIEECRRLGLEVRPPDVNHSSVDFTVEEGAVRFGLGAIKGVGAAAVEAMLGARDEGGPFESIFDFAARAREVGSCNRTTLDALIKAGAFDTMHASRSQLLASVQLVCSYADKVHRDRLAGQEALFGAAGKKRAAEHPPLAEAPELTRFDKLNLEREVLGVFVSDHPLRSVAGALADITTHTTEQLQEMGDGAAVTLGGVITSLRKFHTKSKNELMATGVLEDLTGQVGFAVFPATMERCQQCLSGGALVVMRGRTMHRDRPGQNGGGGQVEVRVESMEALTPPEGDPAQPSLLLTLSAATADQLRLARQHILDHPGSCLVTVLVRNNGHSARYRLPHQIAPEQALLEGLRGVFGERAVEVRG